MCYFLKNITLSVNVKEHLVYLMFCLYLFDIKWRLVNDTVPNSLRQYRLTRPYCQRVCWLSNTVKAVTIELILCWLNRIFLSLYFHITFLWYVYDILYFQIKSLCIFNCFLKYHPVPTCLQSEDGQGLWLY